MAVEPTVMSSRLLNSIEFGRVGQRVVVAVPWEQAVEENVVTWTSNATAEEELLEE